VNNAFKTRLFAVMAPRWPQVNNGPEHINEHAAYLREACNELQSVDRGRTNQVPWNTVQQYIASTLVLISKVLQQPALSEVLQQIQDSVKYTQNIQKDIQIIKSSVGLSTNPLNATNFSQGRATNASWAQIAAHTNGTISLPPPPQSTPAKTQSAVTAYKDRVVTIKLKDHGVAQRYRTHPTSWTRRQVEAAIRDNTATRTVKIVAAHQLKSGDIQVFTSNTNEATQLKENKSWIKGLGERAELVVSTYGVIVHGIPTNSISINDHEATIQQILAENYTVIPGAEIIYVGWLTKESTLKRASSIVLEFADPEMANAIIYAGMVWDGQQVHQCQLYDRACRVKQCFRCYNYGHIGTQCNASQACGYCAEQHESRNCKQKGGEGFTLICAVCKGAHTAWSNACPARKKELGRVEQAKLSRSIYWHVPSKSHNRRNVSDNQERQTAKIIDLTQRTARRPADATGAGLDNQSNNTSTTLEETRQTLNTHTVPHALESARGPDVPLTQIAPGVQQEQAEKDRTATPPTQNAQEYCYPFEIFEGQQQQDACRVEDEQFGTQEATDWLDNIFNDNDAEPQPTAATVASLESPPTSLATDTRTAQGTIYRACKCPEHQEIYSDWPTSDAELVIARCMKTCVYCGKDFETAAKIRRHMRQKYTTRNLTVRQEQLGRGATTPAWTTLAHRADSEPLARQPIRSRITRSQSLANSASNTPRQW
jgi:hypothetical protein